MSSPSSIPRRPYGATGVDLSVIGFGGIVVTDAEQEHANRMVAEAVERGVNYFDVAPGYGNAEEKLGPALEPYRDQVFLACKTGARDRAGAEMEFQRSLDRLRTDHFDLYQLHGITDVEKDVDAVFQKGGVMDMLVEERNAGRIRFLGFSAHTVDAAYAAMDRFDFDSILFPLNFAAAFKGEFGPQILKRAEEKGLARLALKGMARQQWKEDDSRRDTYRKCWYEPITDREWASLALRWTLNQPITAAIPPGIDSLFRMAMDIASESLTITTDEEEKLRQAATSLDVIFQAA